MAEGFHIPKGTKLVETNGVRSRSYETNSNVTYYTWDKEFVWCRVGADLIEIRHVDPKYNDRITTVALKDVLLYY